MQKIIIHLGLHKTGTTFLQKCVFSKLKNVEVQHLMGICQVKFSSDKKILLISSEGLLSSMPHYPDNSTVEDSIEALYRIYPNAKIILGVRNWMHWSHSCWNQYIRDGGTISFVNYLVKYGNSMKTCDYIKPIENRWKNVFVYDQKELKMHPFEVIERMCNFIGVPMPVFEISTVNKSFSKCKIEILRFINMCTNQMFKLNSFVRSKIIYE
jgi:hypothetical protein